MGIIGAIIGFVISLGVLALCIYVFILSVKFLRNVPKSIDALVEEMASIRELLEK